jgi:hypothetical protein
VSATKSRPLCRAHGSVVIPAEQFEAWYAVASTAVGLTDAQLGVLGVISEHCRLQAERATGWSFRATAWRSV